MKVAQLLNRFKRPYVWCGQRHLSGFLCDLPEGHKGPHRTGLVSFDNEGRTL